MTESTTSPTGPTTPRPGARPVAAGPGPTLETATGAALLACPNCGASFPAGHPGPCPVCAAEDPNAAGSPSAPER